jgi:hypothetical protein
VLDYLGFTEPVYNLDNNNEDEELAEEKPYNYFKDQGYEVDYLLGNLGSSLVFIVLLP